MIASYYPLYAVMAGKGILEELIVASVFIAITVSGVPRWPWLVPSALLLHGLFDLVHQALLNNDGVSIWWPSFCATVDVLLAILATYYLAYIGSGNLNS